MIDYFHLLRRCVQNREAADNRDDKWYWAKIQSYLIRRSLRRSEGTMKAFQTLADQGRLSYFREVGEANMPERGGDL